MPLPAMLTTNAINGENALNFAACLAKGGLSVGIGGDVFIVKWRTREHRANDSSSATAEAGAGRAWRVESRRAEARAVTVGAVRCSAWLGVRVMVCGWWRSKSRSKVVVQIGIRRCNAKRTYAAIANAISNKDLGLSVWKLV